MENWSTDASGNKQRKEQFVVKLHLMKVDEVHWLRTIGLDLPFIEEHELPQSLELTADITEATLKLMMFHPAFHSAISPRAADARKMLLDRQATRSKKQRPRSRVKGKWRAYCVSCGDFLREDWLDEFIGTSPYCPICSQLAKEANC